MGVLAMTGAVAGTLVGATAGGADIEAGVFRDLAATGRSRGALFGARVPGAWAVLVPAVLAGVVVSAALALALHGTAPVPAGAILSGGAAALVSALLLSAASVGLAALAGSRGMVIGVVLAFQLGLSPILVDVGIGDGRYAIPSVAIARIGGALSNDVALGVAIAVVLRMGCRDARGRPLAHAHAGDLVLATGWVITVRPMWRAASDVVLRRQAIVVLAVLLAAGAAVPLQTPFPLLGLVPLYGIATNRDWRDAVLAVVGVAAAVCLHAVLYGPTKTGSVLAVTVSMTALAAIVAAVGVASGERRRARQRESALLATQAVAQERLRIARELHDAVGHDVSLMIVQAQALGATAGDERVRVATDAIAALGRHTMGEMSRTLALLRHDGAEHHPQPGLAVLDDVLDGARRAGVAMTLTTEGTPRPLDAALDASAYRIVQEAVTNVVRHAGGAPATVTLRFGPSALELAIVDEGRSVSDPPAAATG